MPKLHERFPGYADRVRQAMLRLDVLANEGKKLVKTPSLTAHQQTSLYAVGLQLHAAARQAEIAVFLIGED